MSQPSLEWTDQTPRPEPPEVLTGKTLAGRFRLDACLIYSATSSVHRGRDLRGRVDVAVKILRSGLDAGVEERFRREGQILAKLRHPNIADFIDCGVTEDGLCYLVTALVAGRSLADACDESAPLTLEQVWQVGLQVAAALSCAHDSGVIHRDVKPSNILWTSAGVAKLIDFGIAKLQPDATLEVTPVRHPTGVGMPRGTPGYFPPEAGDQLDARTDVFALGRTLYRLLARQPVHNAPAGLEETPGPLRQVLLEAMDPDPTSRIATAAEFRRRWFEAGVGMWPQPKPEVAELQPAILVWPWPPDQLLAPSVDPCDRGEASRRCVEAAPSRLFERRLELRTLVGGGRSGQTWRAFHHVLRRDVAVKIVSRDRGPAIVASLCREAMALDKLTHRAFPRVLECDFAGDGSWYMVEEYIDGESLSKTFERAPIDPLAAIDIVTEIAEALCEAHARGILHGDIKGDNLILERTLPSPRPRVIDLSECRLQDVFFATTDQRFAPSPMHREEAPGTRAHPDFAAPELLRGEPKTAASDVYALGVVLFILLTGRRSGAGAIRDIFKAGEPDEAGERLREVVTSIAPELADTFIASDLQNILAPDPAQRTATMADLLDKLRVEGQALRDLRMPAPAPAHTTPDSAPMSETTRPAVPPSRPVPDAPSGRGAPHTPVRLFVAAAAAVSLWMAATWVVVRLAQPSAPATVPVREAPPDPKPPIAPVLVGSSTPAVAPGPLTQEQVQAALDARISEFTRCPDMPARLTLAVEVGPRVTLAEVQHVEVDPTRQLDRCVRSIVESLDLPTSATPRRHVLTLKFEGAAHG